MPENKPEARPVSALCYPTRGLMEKALDSGEVKKLLGAGRGQLARSVSLRGSFLRRRLPGHQHLGERFFDWEKSKSSVCGAQLGRLKPADRVAAELAKVDYKPGVVVEIPGGKLENALGVEEFRKAVSK